MGCVLWQSVNDALQFIIGEVSHRRHSGWSVQRFKQLIDNQFHLVPAGEIQQFLVVCHSDLSAPGDSQLIDNVGENQQFLVVATLSCQRQVTHN